ncbi:OX-2 membrane glycoprotein-like [Embiotoca jacksoni]|uniref:OX-2 membrane glycoprotein-like n=1 Tax=Embiotoca jacksoni TaxID=100190 RepID=UPI003703B751
MTQDHVVQVSSTHIAGNGDTTVDYGGDAHYSCRVANPKGVLQVTWQRLFKDESIENLATYSNRFGEQVNEPYREKVIFNEASLTSTSITVKNVTWADESCYICSFNVYPDGSKRKQACLTVQGILEVNTSHSVSSRNEKEDREAVFNCSATGKPAPTIEWEISPGAASLERPATETVTSSHQTFTSSRSITLKVPPDWSGHVDCVMNSGTMGQRRERIPLSFNEEEKKQEKGKRLPSFVIALIIIAISASCIAVAAVIRQKRLKSKTRTENVV